MGNNNYNGEETMMIIIIILSLYTRGVIIRLIVLPYAHIIIILYLYRRFIYVLFIICAFYNNIYDGMIRGDDGDRDDSTYCFFFFRIYLPTF